MCSSRYISSKAAIYLEMRKEMLFSVAFKPTQYRDIPFLFLQRSKFTMKLDMYSTVTQAVRFPRRILHKYSGVLHHMES
jgi:hypothetical protein